MVSSRWRRTTISSCLPVVQGLLGPLRETTRTSFGKSWARGRDIIENPVHPSHFGIRRIWSVGVVYD